MFHLRRVIVSGAWPVVLGCVLAAQAVVVAQEPVNPTASQKTRAVLKLLYELPNRPDRRVMSGQVLRIMTSGPTRSDPTAPVVYNPNPYSHIQDIYNKYGIWVAIAGAEYTDWWNGTAGVLINHQIQGKILWRQINPALIQHSKNGGIAEIHFHPMSPRNGAGGDADEIGLTADDLLNPGWIHDNWIRYLDEVATGLKQLRDNDVVVIWRPMHGRDSGNSWWWSEYAMAQADYNRIWRHMFEYFTYTWGLNNLLWNQDWYHAGRWSGGDVSHLYVGIDLVDIVSVDSTSVDITPGEYANLLAFGKPIGVGQDGADSSDPTFVDDVGPQIDNIRAHLPRITHHVQFEKDGWGGRWDWKWDLANSNGTGRMLSDSWTLNAPIFGEAPPPPPTRNR